MSTVLRRVLFLFQEALGTDGSSRAFAVNLEAGESDLAAIEITEDLSAAFGDALPWVGSKRLVVVDDAATLGAQAGVGRSRSELWEILMWVVLLIAVLEPALANWITSRHYLKPRSDPKTIAVPTGRIALGGDIDSVNSSREAAPEPEPDEASVTVSQ